MSSSSSSRTKSGISSSSKRKPIHVSPVSGRNLKLRYCEICPERPQLCFPTEFTLHLRNSHCTKEGGSYICRYGLHNVCQALPLDGVSDEDYEDHVRKVHLMTPPMSPPLSDHLGYGSRAGSRSVSPSQSSVWSEGRNTPNVVMDSKRGFTVYTPTQNLSSVLSDPRKTRREIANFFTRDHGADFTEKTIVYPPHHLPKIRAKNFEEYSVTVGKKHRRHLRDERKLSETLKRREHYTDNTDLHTSRERFQPQFGDIPKMFLSPKFNLQDPQIFEAVFIQSGGEESRNTNPFVDEDNSVAETSGTNPFETEDEEYPAEKNPFGDEDEEDGTPDIIPGARRSHGKKAKLKPNRLLQEKLSHYLDTVETQIGLQIASRSDTFFKAMTSHDELQTHLAHTKYAVQRLRQKIGNLDETLVQKSLRLFSLHHSRTNRAEFLKKLQLVATVKEAQQTVQSLLHSYDFLGALELIATTQDVLREELHGIVSFRHLGLQLCELQSAISKLLQEEFVKYIQTELSRPLSADTHLVVDEQQLTSLIMGLLRVKEFRFCDVMKTEITRCAKDLLRQIIREKISIDNVEGDESFSSTLGDQIRRMEFGEWMKLMVAVFDTLLIFCKKIELIQNILLDLMDIAAGRSVPPSTPSSKLPTATHIQHIGTELDVRLEEGDYFTLRNTVSQLTLQVTTIVQERCARVFSARAKENQMDKLNVEDFVSIYQLVEVFTIDCEKVTDGKKLSALRSSLQSQASRFAIRFHEDRKAKLGNILDSEQWRAAEVPSVFQEIVTNCESTGFLRDIPHSDTSIDGSGSKTGTGWVVVEGEKFVVVGTSLLLLQMVAQYCQTLNQLPFLAPDLLSRLVELLKNFNSRTCQLILGAGALQLVGLKTISAKTLAIASRCLQLIAKFIPIAQAEFERHLAQNQSHMIRHFTQVLKDYEDHIQELFNKLLSVMEHHLTSCINKWECKPPTAPSPCFQQISKHIRRFHDSLAGIFPPHQTQILFLRVHDTFKDLFRTALVELDIGPHDGARYDFACSEFSFYMETMKSLPTCAALSDTMGDVFSHK